MQVRTPPFNPIRADAPDWRTRHYPARTSASHSHPTPGGAHAYFTKPTPLSTSYLAPHATMYAPAKPHRLTEDESHAHAASPPSPPPQSQQLPAMPSPPPQFHHHHHHHQHLHHQLDARLSGTLPSPPSPRISQYIQPLPCYPPDYQHARTSLAAGRLTRASSRRSVLSMQPSLHSTPSLSTPVRHTSYHTDGATATTSTLSSFLKRRRRGRCDRSPLPRSDDRHHNSDITLQGYCRMSWFARLRCTRYLRLVHNSLHCFDSSMRNRLWVVLLHGARVRIHMPDKIILSKLQCGFLVEFYVYDEQSCKHWASALLEAASKT